MLYCFNWFNSKLDPTISIVKNVTFATDIAYYAPLSTAQYSSFFTFSISLSNYFRQLGRLCPLIRWILDFGFLSFSIAHHMTLAFFTVSTGHSLNFFSDFSMIRLFGSRSHLRRYPPGFLPPYCFVGIRLTPLHLSSPNLWLWDIRQTRFICGSNLLAKDEFLYWPCFSLCGRNARHYSIFKFSVSFRMSLPGSWGKEWTCWPLMRMW